LSFVYALPVRPLKLDSLLSFDISSHIYYIHAVQHMSFRQLASHIQDKTSVSQGVTKQPSPDREHVDSRWVSNSTVWGSLLAYIS